MTGKLSLEGEVIAAYGAAMVAAFQVLINCLEENDAILPGQRAWSRHGDGEEQKGRRKRHDPCSAPRYLDGYTGLVVPERKKSSGSPFRSLDPILVAVAGPASKSWT
jgi:hypothetical protein